MGWTTSTVRRTTDARQGETPTESPSTWGWLTGRDGPATPAPAPVPQEQYCPQELPIPMRRAPVPPWVRELTRLLDSRAASGEALPSLRRVERALRTQAGHALPESLVRGAASELRWVARRSPASPALARLMDRFENEVVLPAQRARQGRR